MPRSHSRLARPATSSIRVVTVEGSEQAVAVNDQTRSEVRSA
jgi:hypothetical protein